MKPHPAIVEERTGLRVIAETFHLRMPTFGKSKFTIL